MLSVGNIANGDVLKINIVFVVIGAVILSFTKKLRLLFKKSKKKALIYLLFVLATFALAGLLSSSKVLNDTPLNSFYGFQIVFLALGILHVYILRRVFPDLSEKPSDFFAEFLFSLVYLLLGLVIFTQIVNRLRSPFSILFMGASIMFMLPLMVYKLYEFAIAIPVAIYESWRFPLNEEIKDPTNDELANPRVISFEFRKTSKHQDITNFRVKAPKGMEFGRLFYFFIMDYNERHLESPIAVSNSEDEACEWMFYMKPHWYSGIRHINTSSTVDANHIKENAVVICKRVND